MSSESERWKHLANRLGIEAVAPFALDVSGKRAVFAALIPQFGGTAGMIVDPDWSTIEPHQESLLSAGYGFSCLELGDADDDDSAREMFSDWGWSSDGQPPDWL